MWQQGMDHGEEVDNDDNMIQVKSLRIIRQIIITD